MNIPKVPSTYCLISLILLISIGFYIFNNSSYSKSGNEFKVHFLDVGQGDSIFLETPGGYQILVDGGRSERVLSQLGRVMAINDKDIDMVVATHPDADHIGGLVFVLQKFDVGRILKIDTIKDTKTAKVFEELVSKEGAEVVNVKRAFGYELSDGTLINILWPQKETRNAGDDNDKSIVMQVKNKDAEVLLSGDASKKVETKLVGTFPNMLRSELLKAGHHGSKTSSSLEFFSRVDPSHIVFSYGARNSYGHPHDSVINLARGFAKLYHTKDGRQTFVSKNGLDFEFAD